MRESQAVGPIFRYMLAVLFLSVAVAPLPATPMGESQSDFAVAGIHIGDTPAQVREALSGLGYKIIKVTKFDSYQKRLLDARNLELRRAPTAATSLDVGSYSALLNDQRIYVRFDDNDSGTRVVAYVRYETSYKARPFPVVGKKLVERYGEPNAADATGAVWCIGGKQRGCGIGGNDGVWLKIGHDYLAFNGNAELTVIELHAGRDAERRWAAAYRADIARLLRSKDGF